MASTGGFFYVSGKQTPLETIDGVGGETPTTPTGVISQAGQFFFDNNNRGEPRRENLFLVRLLGQTAYIEWIKDIIKKQVAATRFNVQPRESVETVTDEMEAKAEEIEEFLQGGFNRNDTSWNDLINILMDDILDMDSGILELIPDEQGFLDRMIPRDGATFTKNVKENGFLPGPDSDEPAYFQFGLGTRGEHLFRGDLHGINIDELIDDLEFAPHRITTTEEKEFSRDQIVWFSENQVSYSSYGRGRTQKVKRVSEVLLNGDIHRNKFFIDNEFHKGFIKTMGDVSQQQREDLERIFKDSKGDEYSIPIVGGGEDTEWVSIDPDPSKMQFLESHKWYTKIVLMSYGLNEAEAGMHENANLSVSEEMKFNVWRRTTQPLLQMIEEKINENILPFMRQQHAVNGALKFKFEPNSRFLRKLEQEIEEKELQLGNMTVNELRSKHGKEDYGPVGDLPKTVFESLAQQNPGWTAEQISDEIDDTPSPQPPALTVTDGNDEPSEDEEPSKISPYPDSYHEAIQQAG